MKRFFVIILLLLSLCCIFATTVNAQEVQATEVVVENNVYSDSVSDDAWIPDITSIIVTLLVSGGAAVFLVMSHNKANRQISATNYVAENGYKVNRCKEQYIRTYTTTQHNFYGSNNKK